MPITNRELQDIVGDEITQIDNSTLGSEAKAKAIVRLGSIHIRCTRVELESHRTAKLTGHVAPTDMPAIKLTMPVLQ